MTITARPARAPDAPTLNPTMLGPIMIDRSKGSWQFMSKAEKAAVYAIFVLFYPWALAENIIIRIRKTRA